MVATVAVVYSIVFQDASMPMAEVWWKKAPIWIQDWISNQVTSSRAAGHGSLYIVLIIPAVFMIRGVVNYLNIYLLNWVAVRVVSNLRVTLFSHLLSLPSSFFGGSRAADLMSRVLADTETLRATMGNSLTSLVKDPVTVVSMLAFLLWQHPKITGLSLLVMPVCIVPIVIYGRKGRKAAATMQEDLSNLTHSMMESFTGNRIVKAYNLEAKITEQFRETANAFVSNFMRMVRSVETPGPLLELAGAVGITFLLVFAVGKPGTQADGSSFLTVVLAIITMYRPLKSVVKLQATMLQAEAASGRVFELLATKSTLLEPTTPKKVEANGADVRFEGVSFTYTDKPVLRDIRLTVKAGSLVALVGSSGSGKTTLTNLLLRFFDPSAGSIYIGNTELREASMRDLREQIAIVTQETILFNDTIKNNIGLGRPNATQEEIVVAAKHAFAHDFIMQKPDGYATVIGDRGSVLSGGQRQRLAIARAILKNAPILILDEATSSLDNESERTVQAALEELMDGRTTICIAHRLSTIQNADLIVVMAEGQIVETGTHQELLEKRGAYFGLHQIPGEFRNSESE